MDVKYFKHGGNRFLEKREEMAIALSLRK